MALGQGDGKLCEGEKTACTAAGVMHSVRCNAIQSVTLEVVGELAVRNGLRLTRAQQQRLIFVRAPGGHEAENDSALRTAKVGKFGRAKFRAAKLFDTDGFFRPVVEYANEHDMWQETLHLPLCPQKKLMSLRYASR